MSRVVCDDRVNRTGGDQYISEPHLKKTYRKHSPAFETKEAKPGAGSAQGARDIERTGPALRIASAQIAAWKKEFLEGAEQVFSDGPVVDAKAHVQEKAELHRQIGELTAAVIWLKKSAVMPWMHGALMDQELAAKPADKGGLSLIKQCTALEIHRSGLYYTPRPVIVEDLELMRLMDLLHLEDPTKGAACWPRTWRTMALRQAMPGYSGSCG